MKKVFNLRIECNSPTFVMTDKEFCQGLEEVVADEFGEEMKYVKLKAEPCDKDEQLAIYKRALELACFNVDCMYCNNFECRKEPYNEKHNCIECGELGLTQKHLSKYFLDLAKEKLEKGEDVE